MKRLYEDDNKTVNISVSDLILQSHSKKQIYLAEYCVKIAVCDCVVMRKQKPIFCLIGTT